MKMHWLYMRYVVRHKWYVFLAGLQLRVPLWRLVLHDWTKFLPREWLPYARWFYGGWRQNHYTGESDAPPDLKAAYDRAWCHHMHKNDHHWQFWVMVFDMGDEAILPMSDAARREMLADWIGAGRAIMGKAADTRMWYLDNRHKMRLHSETRAWIETQLSVAGGRSE